MSKPDLATRLIAFSDGQCVAEGMPEQVVTCLKSFVERGPERNLLILNAVTSRNVELDLRDSAEEVLTTQFSSPVQAASASTGTKSSGSEQKRGRGRPKLGVVSREVTLLPRHWDWLSSQPGGASVALRRLVDQARNNSSEQDKRRTAQDSAYRFMTVLAGDAQGYEESIRLLYANDLQGLREIIASWPPDVARHAEWLAGNAIAGGE